MALETSAPLGSVALAVGPQIMAQKTFTAKLRHASELLATMDILTRKQKWQPSDIDQLYVSAGPGSFTGIRIAVTAAKTLAFAQKTNIVSVPSIEAHALNAENAARDLNLDFKFLAVVLEAGRNQIFAAVFEKVGPADSPDKFLPGFRTLIAPALMTPAQLLAQAPRPLFLLGEGLKYHPADFDVEEVISLPEKYHQPQARNVLRCGWPRAQANLFVEPDTFTPTYMRRPEAVEKWEKLHGTK